MKKGSFTLVLWLWFVQFVPLQPAFATESLVKPSNVTAPENAPTCAGVTVVMTVKFDNYPEEFYYRLFDGVTAQLLFESDLGYYQNSNATENIEFCLERGKLYTLKIYDAFGDGFCYDDGYVSLDYDKDDLTNPGFPVFINFDNGEGCYGHSQIIHSFTTPTLPPTCNDGIQNQDETGIDCGGACGVCSEPVFSNPPSNATLSYAEALAHRFSNLSYSNNVVGDCAISGTVVPVVVDDYTVCGGTRTATWSFTDRCGRPISHSQTITVSPA
ncbi:MAG: hypothetical protein NWR67_08955, partial [Saprospiraceae bacterium]|nr:hypothetical protein [Saprospiraceae bacterium]